MKVHVLLENSTSRDDLAAEHGLSLLIEMADMTILFDTGATSAFAANATRMGKELRDVDIAVLSHGHYDHGGGLASFLNINHHAKVYISPHAFTPHFNARGKDIGLAPHLSASKQMYPVTSSPFIIRKGAVIHSAEELPLLYPPPASGMTSIINGERVDDDFRHEQYLMLEENGRRVLISGCSHKGILNLCAHFRPDVLIGGFHLMTIDPLTQEHLLARTAELLNRFPTQFYTGHCTGEAATAYLQEKMGNRLQSFSTGTVIEL